MIAHAYTITCTKCSGSGWYGGDDCPRCVGRGLVYDAPSSEDVPVRLDEIAPWTQERCHAAVRDVLRSARVLDADALARTIVGALAGDVFATEALGRDGVMRRLVALVDLDLADRVLRAHCEAILEHARLHRFGPPTVADPTGEKRTHMVLALERHARRLGGDPS